MPAHARAHGARTAPAPSPPRLRPASARPVAGRARRAVRRGSTGVFERLRALPDHRVVDRLLRGRAWIWLIGLLLGGIVAMQVSLLKLNAGISRAVTTAARSSARTPTCEAAIAQLSSGERVRDAAAGRRHGRPAGRRRRLPPRPRRTRRRARRAGG